MCSSDVLRKELVQLEAAAYYYDRARFLIHFLAARERIAELQRRLGRAKLNTDEAGIPSPPVAEPAPAFC
jgi:hypothetical protein